MFKNLVIWVFLQASISSNLAAASMPKYGDPRPPQQISMDTKQSPKVIFMPGARQCESCSRCCCPTKTVTIRAVNKHGNVCLVVFPAAALTIENEYDDQIKFAYATENRHGHFRIKQEVCVYDWNVEWVKPEDATDGDPAHIEATTENGHTTWVEFAPYSTEQITIGSSKQITDFYRMNMIYGSNNSAVLSEQPTWKDTYRLYVDGTTKSATISVTKAVGCCEKCCSACDDACDAVFCHPVTKEMCSICGGLVILGALGGGIYGGLRFLTCLCGCPL
jgi:hypothetical protein